MAHSKNPTPSSGFTLIEMLVAISVFTVVMIGLLNLLDNSTRVSKIEAALADTQENVRYATYHLMRTARMMGGSTMPFARGGGSGNAWVAGEVHDNQATNFSLWGTTLDNMPGSDILILRGFFDVEPFFISSADVNPSAMTVTIREHTDATTTPRLINDLSDFVTIPNVFENRGLSISTGQGGGLYTVGVITGSTGVTGTDPNRQIVLTYGPSAAWDVLNEDGTAVSSGQPNYFNPSRAGILEAYAYYVDNNLVLRRLAQRDVALGNGPQPVAVNIGNLQIELGIDADSDGFLNPALEWDASPTLVEALAGEGAVAMRMTVLGRIPFEIADWTEPGSTFAGAGNITPPTAGVSGPRHAKWRRMEVAVALRNFL